MKVKCIEGKPGFIEEGVIYEVDYEDKRAHYYLKGLLVAVAGPWRSSRFEVVKEEESTSPPTLVEQPIQENPSPKVPAFDFDTYNSVLPGHRR